MVVFSFLQGFGGSKPPPYRSETCGRVLHGFYINGAFCKLDTKSGGSVGASAVVFVIYLTFLLRFLCSVARCLSP